MKDLVKIESLHGQAMPFETLRAAAVHFLIALCGFITARAVITENLMPFGLSFAAGVPVYFTPAAAIGVFIGYFIPAIGSGGFRHIAAMVAIIAIKLLLANHKKLIGHPIFLSVVCLLCGGVSSIVTFIGLPARPLALLTEVLLASGGCYFVSRTAIALKKPTAGLSIDELAALLITINMLIAGADSIKPGGISIGRVIGVLLILICAKYGGTLSGAISGIAVSFTAVLTGTEPTIAAIYAFSGLMAGVFLSYGKYVQMTALLISSLIGTAISPFTPDTVLRLMESISGSLFFLFIPRSAGVFLGKFFCIHPQIASSDGLKKAVTMRLRLASNALSDVSQTVENVSRELSKINSPDFSGVIAGIEQEACGGCKLRLHCWESKKSSTIEAILAMTKAVKEGEHAPETAAAPDFRGRCLRLQRLGSCVYRNYSAFTSKTAAESRIEDVRSVISDQFDGISSMLTDLSLDIQREEKFDHSTAMTAALSLKNINIHAEESSCSVDKFGRMTLKIKVRRNADLIINKRQIMKLISLVCDRDFDVPNVSEVGNDVFITLSERSVYRVQIGVHQLSASKTAMCGDACQYFNDGQGHYIMILSDGMGTGGRAAVDGAMASGLMARLLKAGFGYECSLRILNSSMLFKSTDESLATVDIASIDLYTGETVLHKAGAAPTLVRRSGHTGKAVSHSLPVGILRDVGFDTATIRMKVGDILLLMSDGATSEGTDWIRTELEAWQDGDAEDLAEHICECARRRRSDNHEDDITVMAAIIRPAV